MALPVASFVTRFVECQPISPTAPLKKPVRLASSFETYGLFNSLLGRLGLRKMFKLLGTGHGDQFKRIIVAEHDTHIAAFGQFTE